MASCARVERLTLDEHREAEQELAALDRDAADETREVLRVAREWTTDDGLTWFEHVSIETGGRGLNG